jgi:hypothetical protein
MVGSHKLNAVDHLRHNTTSHGESNQEQTRDLHHDQSASPRWLSYEWDREVKLSWLLMILFWYIFSLLSYTSDQSTEQNSV